MELCPTRSRSNKQPAGLSKKKKTHKKGSWDGRGLVPKSFRAIVRLSPDLRCNKYGTVPSSFVSMCISDMHSTVQTFSARCSYFLLLWHTILQTPPARTTTRSVSPYFFDILRIEDLISPFLGWLDETIETVRWASLGGKRTRLGNLIIWIISGIKAWWGVVIRLPEAIWVAAFTRPPRRGCQRYIKLLDIPFIMQGRQTKVERN